LLLAPPFFFDLTQRFAPSLLGFPFSLVSPFSFPWLGLPFLLSPPLLPLAQIEYHHSFHVCPTLVPLDFCFMTVPVSPFLLTTKELCPPYSVLLVRFHGKEPHTSFKTFQNLLLHRSFLFGNGYINSVSWASGQCRNTFFLQYSLSSVFFFFLVFLELSPQFFPSLSFHTSCFV